MAHPDQKLGDIATRLFFENERAYHEILVELEQGGS